MIRALLGITLVALISGCGSKSNDNSDEGSKPQTDGIAGTTDNQSKDLASSVVGEYSGSYSSPTYQTNDAQIVVTKISNTRVQVQVSNANPETSSFEVNLSEDGSTITHGPQHYGSLTFSFNIATKALGYTVIASTESFLSKDFGEGLPDTSDGPGATDGPDGATDGPEDAW